MTNSLFIQNFETKFSRFVNTLSDAEFKNTIRL